MSATEFPACPQCGQPNTYPDADLFICPDCAHEWSAQATADEDDTGPRVIKETTKQTLPAGFQSAEFLLKHGLVDQIVSRLEQRDRIRDLLSALHVRKKPAAAPLPVAAGT